MKLYVTNIPPASIKANLDKISIYQISKREIYELFSEEYGLHIIENIPSKKEKAKDDSQMIYKVEAQFETDYHLIKGHQYRENNISKCDLLFDLTIYKNVPVVSQLPVKYVLTKIQRFSYKLNKKSNWTLVIDCIRETNTETMDKELIPVNYYFCFSDNIKRDNIKTDNIKTDNIKTPKKEFKEIINDLLFQDEINMFLSHLI